MERYEEMEDEALIARLRQGETGIYDYLMEKYKNLVRKKARALFLVGGDTDDLIQEGMIGLFKAVRDYRDDKEASFQTFARMCIDRQLYHAVQNSNRMKHQPLNTSVPFGEGEDQAYHPSTQKNPERILIEREALEDLRRKIDAALSPMEGRVLKAYLEGDSYEVIAQALGKTPKSVDNALRRIRDKIKKISHPKMG